MRALAVGLAAIFVTTGCADEGNLIIRCPGAGGATSVSGGQATIDGVAMRVTAELSVPEAADRGGTFVIEVQLPTLPSDTSPRIECVRMKMVSENAQWDAVPTRIAESRDASMTRIRTTGGEGPHWRPEEQIDVTVWLRTASGRHVLSLGAQRVRRVD